MNSLEQDEKAFKKLAVIIVSAVLLLMGVLIFFFGSMYSVKTGEVAVISKFGKVNRISRDGLHFKLPFIESKSIIETRERLYTFNSNNPEKQKGLLVSTKDLQSVSVEISVQASINDPEKLYRAFQGHHEERFIRPRIREVVQSNIAKYTIEEFVSKRSEISQLLFQDLKDDFEKYGVLMANVSITDHDFSDAYEKAVEAKKVAEQEVEKTRFQTQKQQVEAENKVKVAEFAVKEKELEAKANAVMSQSLTPQLLEKMKYEKWDGKLPQVQGGNPIIKIEQNK